MSKVIYFYGVMKASKTAQLLTMNYNYKKHGVEPVILKTAKDNKRNKVTSRLGLSAKADFSVNDFFSSPRQQDVKIRNIINRASKANSKVILVDEAQFFSVDFIEQLVKECRLNDIELYGFGLLKDFRGNLFAGAKKWIECADSIREVKTTCELCNHKATCNALEDKDGKLVKETFNKEDNLSNIIIGDTEYHVYCQEHMLYKYIIDGFAYEGKSEVTNGQ